MHIVPRAPVNPAAYGLTLESTESRFDALTNVFGPGSGCTSSWASGCSRHHYHSWNDPTLQKHAFNPLEEGRTIGRETLARGVRAPLRLGRALAVRFFGQRRAG